MRRDSLRGNHQLDGLPGSFPRSLLEKGTHRKHGDPARLAITASPAPARLAVVSPSWRISRSDLAKAKDKKSLAVAPSVFVWGGEGGGEGGGRGVVGMLLQFLFV